MEHDVAADDDYDDVPPLQNLQTNPVRHHHNTGLPPRPPAAPQNKAQCAPPARQNRARHAHAAPKDIAPSAPAASSSTLWPPRVPRSEVNGRYKSSLLLLPRVPQVHRSAITSPCPIQPGKLQMPPNERHYTHSSLHRDKIIICVVHSDNIAVHTDTSCEVWPNI